LQAVNSNPKTTAMDIKIFFIFTGFNFKGYLMPLSVKLKS